MTQSNKSKPREPWSYLNKESRRFMGNDYLGGAATAEERVGAIARGAEAELGIPGYADKLIDYMSRGWISLSTPLWCNAWADRGLPISCFGSYIEDSMESILSKVAEIGMMSKIGGGTSAYFGNLRPRGSDISTGGKSFGSVHFMELFKTVTKIVSQGSTRRGSCAAYLPIDHPDIEEFLRINSTDHIIQDFSFGVTVSDQWLAEMEGGDKTKRLIWTKVIKKRFETGYPYIMFSDTVNNNKPQVYKDKDMKIHATNLCLVGETMLEIADNKSGTNARTIDLKTLCETHFESELFVKSYDGKNIVWSAISAKGKTGHTDELIEIESTNGNIIRCTPEHKILTKDRGWVEAQNLLEDDTLIE